MPVEQGRCRLRGQPGKARLRQAGGGKGALAIPGSEDHDHALGVQAPGGEQQRLPRGAVEPLRVIHETQQSRLVRVLRQEGQHRQPHQHRLRAGRGPEPERRLQGRALRAWQRGEMTERRAQQQLQPRERQLRLELDPRAAGQPQVAGRRGGVVEQRRLADARLAAQHQRRTAPRPRPRQQFGDRVHFGLSSVQSPAPMTPSWHSSRQAHDVAMRATLSSFTEVAEPTANGPGSSRGH
ncbi:hypothetical protein GCM10020001_024550 [Nonomuraea salmonea]